MLVAAVPMPVEKTLDRFRRDINLLGRQKVMDKLPGGGFGSETSGQIYNESRPPFLASCHETDILEGCQFGVGFRIGKGNFEFTRQQPRIGLGQKAACEGKHIRRYVKGFPGIRPR